MPGGNLSLVIGADGLIGRALCQALAAGGDVLGTVLAQPPPSGLVHLDLADRSQSWALPGSVAAAYLCAAITSLEACRRDPLGTAAINVHATVAMAQRLVASGAMVVFLSSNQVYDGSAAFRGASDAPCPTTEYGRQKAEAERQLLAMGPAVAVVRLTKVLAPQTPLVARWRKSLEAGEPIRAFSDMVMAPVSLPLAVRALAAVAAARRPGLYQVSADRDVTYLEAARRIAACLGADPALVRPAEANRASPALETVPPHTTLDMRRVEGELGIAPPSPWEAIDFASQEQKQQVDCRNMPMGGPDSLSIRAAQPQEASDSRKDASCACRHPDSKLSGLPPELQT